MGRAALSERAVILGVNGVVGQALARQLIESGVSVTGLDLQEGVFCQDGGIAYEQCDATDPTSAGLEAIGAADTILICLPEDVAIAALPTLVERAGADSLIVDTLSVKQRVAATLESLRPAQQYLSINPMFSPRLGFSGQNVAIVIINDGPRAAEFESLLASWGAATVSVEADEHDKMTALIQVATHAAIISMGLTLHEWGYDVTKGIRLATPPHRMCLALLARMSDASPEVYWDIQQSNSYGLDARKSLLASVKNLSDVVATGEEGRFEELMAKIAAVIEPLKDELLQCADSIGAASPLTSRRDAGRGGEPSM